MEIIKEASVINDSLMNSFGVYSKSSLQKNLQTMAAPTQGAPRISLPVYEVNLIRLAHHVKAVTRAMFTCTVLTHTALYTLLLADNTSVYTGRRLDR
jgi:hypothetical protein